MIMINYNSIFKIFRIFLFGIIFFCIIFIIYSYKIFSDNNNIEINKKDSDEIINNTQKDTIKKDDPIILNYGIIDESKIENTTPQNNTKNYIILNNKKPSDNKNPSDKKISDNQNSSVKKESDKDRNKKVLNSSKKSSKKIKSLKTMDSIDKYYTIQVGSFKDFSKANKLKKYFLSKKMITFIVIRNINGEYYYRVNIGIFKTKHDAISFYNQNKKMLSRYKPIIFFYSQ